MKNINYVAFPAIVLGEIGAYFVATAWLKQFADKVNMPLFLYIGCTAAVLLIILTAVGVRSYQAANENPAESIKSE